MKAILICILFLISKLNLNAQTLYMSGGLNYSNLRFDYSGGGSFLVDIYDKPAINYGARLGIDIIEKKHLSFGLSLSYNKLGASMTDDNYRNMVKFYYQFYDKFYLEQVSLSPYIKFNVFTSNKNQIYIISGLNLNYNLKVVNLTEDKVIEYVYNRHLNNFNLGMLAGLGYNYKISNILSLHLSAIYNQHIMDLTSKLIGYRTYVPIGYHTNNFFSNIDYLQVLSGISFKLNPIKNQTQL